MQNTDREGSCLESDSGVFPAQFAVGEVPENDQ